MWLNNIFFLLLISKLKENSTTLPEKVPSYAQKDASGHTYLYIKFPNETYFQKLSHIEKVVLV